MLAYIPYMDPMEYDGIFPIERVIVLNVRPGRFSRSFRSTEKAQRLLPEQRFILGCRSALNNIG